jgi:DNA polymerase III epsilon subunit-like protein
MFISLDTETTGTDPDDRLCQLAFKTRQGIIVNELFNPGKPIAIEATAVHHITHEMVQDKSPFKTSPAHNQLSTLIAEPANVIEWLNSTDLDEDMAHTVRHHLARA